MEEEINMKRILAILISAMLAPRLCHFQRHKSGNEKEKKSGNTRKPLVFFIFM
jgi:hypothetical protein